MFAASSLPKALPENIIIPVITAIEAIKPIVWIVSEFGTKSLLRYQKANNANNIIMMSFILPALAPPLRTILYWWFF